MNTQLRPALTVFALLTMIIDVIYGVGGLIAPFIGIKLIDMRLVVFHLT